jgi:uncharacterized repeat protein (TIGR03803 family)
MKKLALIISGLFIALTINAQTELWGATLQGGQHQAGVIFKTDGSGNNFSVKHDFDSINGNIPFGPLLLALDGKLYGVTTAGGLHDKGVLFQYNLITNTYTKKVDFDGLVLGSEPTGLIQATDGNMYGVTISGGAYGLGILFQYNPVTNSLINKLDFDGTVKGSVPLSQLIQASNGMIYGTTLLGGINNKGVLFQYDIMTNIYNKKIDFNGSINGTNPSGKLLQASDGLLYGLTGMGGGNDMGVLFQFDPNNNTCLSKIDFDGIAKGKNPNNGSLIQCIDGKIYGYAKQGGINDLGTMFQFDPLTNIFIKKIDFDGNNGGNPTGSLIQATDGMIYGMTQIGGLSSGVGAGLLFQFDPVTNGYVKKKDFNFTDGSLPTFQLVEVSSTPTNIKKQINSDNLSL